MASATAHAIAVERGYDDIVRIIEDDEQSGETHGAAGAAALGKGDWLRARHAAGADAQPWATPIAWARKKGYIDIENVLRPILSRPHR